ncbi:unnamed protein product [Adineta steineri]|uniref:Vesicle transport protein USE1 n=1 Tax=Adineta steineri TaxID=433720 RepID=A0A818ZEN6_9BILA|nr:unnamed protein product [Adineta steineri]CAF3767961.1 unnamed protein product [Adineta steineri]
MPAVIASSNLLIEKTFRRLLSSTEQLLEEKSIEEWKLDQFINALTNMLNDMHKSMNRPAKKQLDEYKQRIDKLRQSLDPIKLEDQTFPRQVSRPIQTDSIVKEQQQQPEIPTPPMSSSQTEKNLSTSNKSDRHNLNRQQQHIQSEEDRQEDVATSMIDTTKSLKNTAERLRDIVKDDQKKISEAETLIDHNTAKLNVQSKRLKHNAYNVSNCWIYLMLIVVIMTFISLTVFMRMFRKRTTTITYSNKDSKSSLLSNSINQTTINNTNITTTKSTDYISLLLNYANENHTDL